MRPSFSKDSADIGKTPLVQMEIDTGDHPPISQRPYTLALKTCGMGETGAGNFGKSKHNY